MPNIKEWKPSLKKAVNKLENAIITVSGPAIAISGIIAGIDLLTGGTMFKDIAWLSLTWAICLLLTLDFQVLMLGAKASRVYTSDRSAKRKFWEILMIVAIAAAISSVSVQMQSIIARSQATTTYTDQRGEHTRTLTIEEATRDMGINPVALIWERSALVLILIFMSGWLRDEEGREIQQTGQAQQPAPALDYNQIAQALAPMLAPQLAGLKTTIIAELKPLIPEPMNYQAIAGAITPLLPAPATEQPAPALDYEELASALAPFLPKQDAAEPLDYNAIARAITPLFEAKVSAIRTTIIEEIRATVTTPAPELVTISANDQRHRPAIQSQEAASSQPTGASQDDAERDARLETAYQELKSANGGRRVSGRQLADTAKANRKYCNDWLKATHPENEQPGSQERDTDEHEVYTPERELAGVTS